ncbi:hypothetical protein, partial [Viridibacillus soli]|uniref:hypothetical protein n=1 Tax=Viridibacillus soli TaxID=2798301 RepID=UPI001F3B85F6
CLKIPTKLEMNTNPASKISVGKCTGKKFSTFFNYGIAALLSFKLVEVIKPQITYWLLVPTAR